MRNSDTSIGVLALPAATPTIDIHSMRPCLVGLVQLSADVYRSVAHRISSLLQLFSTGNSTLPHGVSLDDQGRIYVA
jgi:hypothetical protein